MELVKNIHFTNTYNLSLLNMRSYIYTNSITANHHMRNKYYDIAFNGMNCSVYNQLTHWLTE